MSQLIADRNTLQMLQGIDNYTKWMYWVFEKPLTQLDEESEDIWLERLLHTSMAIIEQIYFTENQTYSDISLQKTEMHRLTNRLKDFVNIIGFIPSMPGSEGFEYLMKTSTSAHENLVNKKQSATSKLHQLLGQMVLDNDDTSIHSFWSFFHNNVGEEINDLIEIISVSDLTSAKAKMHWRDAITGIEGIPITRKSLATAISKIKTELKNK